MQAIGLIACFLSMLACAGGEDGGLYNASDQVVIFTDKTLIKFLASTLKQNYYVEFYHSNCGHCINYAPIFKLFAASVRGWNDTVKIAVIDCNKYSAVCADNQIKGYPTCVFYKRGPPPHKGNVTAKGATPSEIRKIVLKQLKSETFLKPISESYARRLKDGTVVLAAADSFIAPEVLLDLKRLKYPLYWIRSTHGAAGVIVMQVKEGKLETVRVGLMSRAAVRDAVIEIWKVPLPKIQYGVKTSTKGTSGKQKSSLINYRERPQFVDVYSSFFMALSNDVPLHSVIKGSNLTALLNFISVNKEYFSYMAEKNEKLHDIADKLAAKLTSIEKFLRKATQVTRAEWEKLLNTDNPLPKVTSWSHCEGSQAYYRRYPCGLWTLFHSLLVFDHLRAGEKEDYDNPLRVLTAIRDFVVNFFSCTECAQNFKKEVKEINTINSKMMAVMYFWMVHNSVNRRLSGDSSEDPKFLKIQFPSVKECAECRMAGKQRLEWNRSEVLSFLTKFYDPANFPLGPSWPTSGYNLAKINSDNSSASALSSNPSCLWLGILVLGVGNFLATIAVRT